MSGAGGWLIRGGRWLAERGRNLRDAPGTLSYLVALLVIQLTLSTVDDRLEHRLLLSESSNLANMGRVPAQVLLGSAFWIDAGPLVTGAALVGVLVVLTPLERWVGSLRWLITIVTGHIGATLLTLLATTCLLRHGLLSPSITHGSDVGVSYALLTALGMLVYRLPRRTARLVAAALGSVGLAAVAVVDQRMVDLGHLLSFLIGLGLYGLVPVVRPPTRPKATRQSRNRPQPVDVAAPRRPRAEETMVGNRQAHLTPE